MTIRKGEAWGTPRPLPTNGVTVHSDAEAARVVTAARLDGRPLPTLGLLGGDLCRTLGGRGDEHRLRSEEAISFSCDVGDVLLDGHLHWFVAHLVVRKAWWRGQARAVMNAAWLDDWNLGPAAHPNDGLLDTVEARLRPRDLLGVRSRLRLGAHLPHPRITTRRTAAVDWVLDEPTPVWLDGVLVGPATEISIRVVPDAITVVI